MSLLHVPIRRQCRPAAAGAAVALACVLLASASAACVAGARVEPWRVAGDEHGIRIATRPVPGERFEQLRLDTSLDVAPAVIADFLFGPYLDARNRNIRRTFVERGPALTIWSDVLRAPLISVRCYSMRFEREDRADGEVRIRFASLAYAGAEPMPGCTALRSRGEWVMTPAAGRGTRLRYVSLTDIGGSVPVAFARRSLSAAALLSVRKVVAGASGLPVPRGPGD